MKNLSSKVSEELYKKLKIKLAKDGITFYEANRQLIEKYVNDEVEVNTQEEE